MNVKTESQLAAEYETRELALAIARRHAKQKPQSYYSEPFYPHDWVIGAIAEALHTNWPASPTQDAAHGGRHG